MNILFLTQSKTLSVFYDVMCAIGERTNLGKIGFYVADSAFFETFRKQHPKICSGAVKLLKEWEIIEKSRKIKPDIERLRDYERRYGDPSLWNALVADRRIYLGRRATLEQDYSSRFCHNRMLAILQAGIEEVEAFFDCIQPDFVVGFICVTIGEYLSYLVAKSRKIRFLNLRPTRIKNYFFAGESVLEPSLRLGETYRRMLAEGVPEHLKEEISAYLSGVRKTHAMYEGVLQPPGISTSDVGKPFFGNGKGLVGKLGGLAKQYYYHTLEEYRHDNHHQGVFYPIWFQKIKRPARIRMADFFLRRHYVRANQLASIDYAFYPLHKEPEVTLLVYSRPYLNQIEVVRNIARSLPVGMRLLVKEHPGALGYRKLSYYRKLMAIPNVLLAPPELTSHQLIQNARLVLVISGSIGLEALMLKKPVITLGRVSFNFLPEGMIRHVRDMDQLAWETHNLLETHKHDETALVAYVATVMDRSVPVDFYSVLLGRKGVYRPSEEAGYIGIEYQGQIERLSEYVLELAKAKND